MKRKIVFLFIFIIIIIFCEISQAKYVIEETILIAKINIDTVPPKIELKNITSIQDQNKNYQINIRIKVIENNIKENHFNKDKININIGDEKVNKELYFINKVEEMDNCIVYEIQIDKIMLEGKLKIIIPEGVIQDYANNKNKEKIIENNF